MRCATRCVNFTTIKKKNLAELLEKHTVKRALENLPAKVASKQLVAQVNLPVDSVFAGTLRFFTSCRS